MVYNIFIFRRDLRIIDNKGLIFAQQFENVVPIFIFTPEQITKNKYKSDNAVQFMCESLAELDQDLKKLGSKLHIFYGDNITVLSKIIKSNNVENIIFNQDYTPYARARDKSIQKLCKTHDIACHMPQDYLLADMGKLLKKDNTPYTVFTPFKLNGFKHKVDKPNLKKPTNLLKLPKSDITKELISLDDKRITYKHNPHKLVVGGRTNGLYKLKQIDEQKSYNDDRNTLNIATTQLSAYIKFGCVSIREVYWEICNKLGPKNDLLGQIFWREFYFYIAYYFPRVLKGKNFNKKYDKIKWKYSKKLFDAWCKGSTGYPVVDAGMRELNKTGYMHNRARLITSNFLNRILNLDWRWSELYYAQKLTDYDPAVNSGNHQWIASVGVDPKPYFQRLFNPWLQSKKFDPQAEYIKKWVPELKDIPVKDIHTWESTYKKHKTTYPKPIVDYKTARATSVTIYKKISN